MHYHHKISKRRRARRIGFRARMRTRRGRRLIRNKRRRGRQVQVV
jgi:ribosomal protein L34